jgi:uncharacterized protein (TIGR00645 family)
MSCVGWREDKPLPPETMARTTGEALAARSGEGMAEAAERSFGRLLLAARWLLAPIYLGLLACVILLIVKFVQDFVNSVHGLLAMSATEVILDVLQLVDIALVANLVLIVVFAGWQAVIGPLLGGGARSQFTGLGFGAVKLRLIASIAAIAAILILETFMHVDQGSTVRALWQLAILLGIGLTGVLLALMDRLSETR